MTKFPIAKRTLSAIALGSNLGDSLDILERSLKRLSESPGVSVKSKSSWYKTVPIGPVQPDFLNGCALLEVEKTPEDLLLLLQTVEKEFGRDRDVRWGPRTLDLDLLLFDRAILHTPHLQIPHPRIRERAFVLVPLAQIAPDLIEPVSGKTIGRLLQDVDTSGVKLYRY